MTQDNAATPYASEQFWARWERLTEPVPPALLRGAQLGEGDNLVDIGCGAGSTALPAAREVGTAGKVVGFDLEPAALELLAARARDAGIGNIEIAQGDAERDPLPGAPFDIAINQFGLTFAKDLEATFSRIREHLRRGGRCVFTAWATAGENPLLPIPLLSRYRTDSGQQDPFSMSEADDVVRMLRSAGFVDVDSTTLRTEHLVERQVVFEPARLKPLGLEPAVEAEAERTINSFIDGFADGEGIRVPLSFHIYEGRNPD